jgi:hypothetical protein
MMPSRSFSRIASANKVDLGARALRSAGRVAALAFLEAALLGGCFVRGHGLILSCPITAIRHSRQVHSDPASRVLISIAWASEISTVGPATIFFNSSMAFAFFARAASNGAIAGAINLKL